MPEGPDSKNTKMPDRITHDAAETQSREGVPQSAEGAKGQDLKENKSQKPEKSREEIEQERIALESKILGELSKLNEIRARLDLPPVETSEAVKAYRNQLITLPAGENPLAESDPAYQFEDESTITPEIRYYFNEILGREETMRRLQEMGPKVEPKIRELMTGGKLNELIWRFTLLDPELRERAKVLDKPWHEEQSRMLKREQNMNRDNPEWGRAFLSIPPSHRLYQERLFRDVERSMKRQATPEKTMEREPLSKEEQVIQDKISQIPDEFRRLRQFFSTIDAKTRQLVLSDEDLLKSTPEDYQKWQEYLEPVFKQMNL